MPPFPLEVALPKLDFDTIPQTNSTGYPEEYADVVQGRWYRRLAPASGITDFGFSHVTLKPGAWSAHGGSAASTRQYSRASAATAPAAQSRSRIGNHVSDVHIHAAMLTLSVPATRARSA